MAAPAQGRSPRASMSRGRRHEPSTDQADARRSLRKLAATSGPTGTRSRPTTPARPSSTSPATHQITQIVVGSSQRSRWQELIGGGSIVRKVSRLAGRGRHRRAHHRPAGRDRPRPAPRRRGRVGELGGESCLATPGWEIAHEAAIGRSIRDHHADASEVPRQCVGSCCRPRGSNPPAPRESRSPVS